MIKRLVTTTVLVIFVFALSLKLLAASPSEFVWLEGLESYGFLIERFEVDGNVRIILRRGGILVETAVGHYAAFVNYRELMVLTRPAYIDTFGNIFVPRQLLAPFNLPLDTEFPLPNPPSVVLSFDSDTSSPDIDNTHVSVPLLADEGSAEPSQEVGDPHKPLEGQAPRTESQANNASQPSASSSAVSDDIANIHFEIGKDNYFRLRVDLNTDILGYNLFRLGNPDRIVIDLFGPQASANVISVEFGPVKALRIGQHEGGSTRFVVDLTQPMGYAAYVSKRGFDLQVTPVSNFELAFDDVKGEAYLHLQGDQLLDAFHLNSPHRIVLDIAGKLTSKTQYITFSRGLISQVRISEFSKEPLISRVVIENRDIPAFRIESGSGDHIEVLIGEIASLGKQGLASSGTSSVHLGPSTPMGQLKGKTIVVDAGHGGSDPGAIRGNIKEKDINLAVALEFASLLKQYGANVLLTRSSDTFVTLYDRAQIANKANADIFISIHTNSHDNPTAHGIEVFYGWDHSLELARTVERSLCLELGRYSRGVKHYRYYVIRATKMPAILVELGFITNEEDREKFLDPNFARDHALVLLKAVLDYFD